MGWGTFPDVQRTKKTAREATAFVITACKLSARLSPLSASSSALRGGYFPNVLLGREEKETRAANTQQSSSLSH